MGQSRLEIGRAQIGKQVEAAAQPKKSAFRAFLAGKGIPLRAADCTQQHTVAC